MVALLQMVLTPYFLLSLLLEAVDQLMLTVVLLALLVVQVAVVHLTVAVALEHLGRETMVAVQ
jgi:hypothetical protein